MPLSFRRIKNVIVSKSCTPENFKTKSKSRGEERGIANACGTEAWGNTGHEGTGLLVVRAVVRCCEMGLSYKLGLAYVQGSHPVC